MEKIDNPRRSQLKLQIKKIDGVPVITDNSGRIIQLVPKIARKLRNKNTAQIISEVLKKRWPEKEDGIIDQWVSEL